jgi:hypothetical protein
MKSNNRIFRENSRRSLKRKDTSEKGDNKSDLNRKNKRREQKQKQKKENDDRS